MFLTPFSLLPTPLAQPVASDPGQHQLMVCLLHWRSIFLLLAASLALTLALAACGGGGGGAPIQTNPGTTTGNYTLTITGTVGSGSTADRHTLQLTLNVN